MKRNRRTRRNNNNNNNGEILTTYAHFSLFGVASVGNFSIIFLGFLCGFHSDRRTFLHSFNFFLQLVHLIFCCFFWFCFSLVVLLMFSFLSRASFFFVFSTNTKYFVPFWTTDCLNFGFIEATSAQRKQHTHRKLWNTKNKRWKQQRKNMSIHYAYGILEHSMIFYFLDRSRCSSWLLSNYKAVWCRHRCCCSWFSLGLLVFAGKSVIQSYYLEKFR